MGPAPRMGRIERQPRAQVVALDLRQRAIDRLDGGEPSRRELVQHPPDDTQAN